MHSITCFYNSVPLQSINYSVPYDLFYLTRPFLLSNPNISKTLCIYDGRSILFFISTLVLFYVNLRINGLLFSIC
jgi:hypothetical protein